MAPIISLSARKLDRQPVTRAMSSSNVAMMVAGDEQTGTAWSSCWMSPWFRRHCNRTFDAVNTKSSTSSCNDSRVPCKIRYSSPDEAQTYTELHGSMLPKHSLNKISCTCTVVSGVENIGQCGRLNRLRWLLGKH